MADGRLVMDAFGMVLDANDAVAALFGCPMDQLIGHNIGHFVALDPLPSTALGRAGGMDALLESVPVLSGLRGNGEPFFLELALTQAWFEGEAYFTGTLKEVSPPHTYEAGQGVATPTAQARAEADPAIPALRPLHVLLAEDHPVNQMLAGMLLGQLGHSHVAANHGQSALDLHAAEAFDLILMDVMMPVMDGLEAMAAVRAREAGTGSYTPVIVVTAHAMAGDRERFLAAGADGYVSKPISAHSLQGEMLRVMSLARPRQGADLDSSQRASNLLSPTAGSVD